MTVKKRVINGLFASGFGQAVTIFIQLAGVPLFLYFLGIEKYGEWLILSTIPAYLAMSDFGFSSVAANDMTVNVAKGAQNQAVITYHGLSVVIFLAALVSGVISASIIFFNLKNGFLPIRYIIANEVSVVIVVLWMQVVVSQVSGQIGAGYRCDGNFAIGSFYGNLIRLIEFISTAGVFLAGGGLVAVVLWMFAVRLIGTFAMFTDLKRRSPWLSLGISRSSWTEIRRLIRPSFAFMAFPMGNAISLQSFTLVIGFILGGSAVVIFSIHRTLTRLPLQMMSMINSAVWPELSKAFGIGDICQAQKLHRLAVGASCWCVFGLLLFLFFAGDSIINHWTGGKVLYQKELFFMLGTVILANSLWFTSSVVAVSINKHERIALIYITGSVISLGVALLLGQYYGLVGIALGLLMIDVFMVYFVIRQSMVLTGDTALQLLQVVINFPQKLLHILLQALR